MFVMRAKMISVGLLGAAILLPLDAARTDQLGHASWYSLPSNITANGERMDPDELTAAHRSLPFGTKVLVENLSNGRSVVVRINDRGPFIGGRIIDLSKAAAASIGMIDAGTARVRVTTADGSVLAALGEATAKARANAKADANSGTASTAKVKAEVSGTKVTALASKAGSTKSLAARASAGTQIAEAFERTRRMQIAVASQRAAWRKRFAASSRGLYAPARWHVADDRFSGSSERHPYPMLTATPGFIMPSRTRRLG